MPKPAKNYKQFGKKWAKKMYSSRGDKRQTMKVAGCAPTAAAIVLATFCDETITPADVADWFVDFKFRKDGSGTKPGCFKWVATRFKGHGITRFLKTTSAKTAQQALEQGALVVAHMGPGYWTKDGHYIVLWKIENGVAWACDPGSSKRDHQAWDAFKKEVKSGYYCFWP